MNVLETARLTLRHLSPGDAEFILELLNDPSFVQNIGDRGVRTTADAVCYIEKIVDGYQRLGFGLYLVALTGPGTPLGICGLVKRESLEDVDVGFAFLPRFWSKGYAFESASAVMVHAREALGIRRVVAVVSPDNEGSIRLLEKLGLRFERMVRMPGSDAEIKLFAPPS